jgi:16S rRNA (cytosine1402-N4)-methyltransferase
MTHEYHIPVMAQASIDALNIKPDGIYIDATFGGGGHSRLILEKLTTGKLIAFDRDDDAVKNIPDDKRFLLINHNYAYLKQFLTYLNIDVVDGILADLGISSHQIDTSERGFAHRFDGPLDMRMNQKGGITASHILNHYSAQELTRVFRDYGELNQAKRIAETICQSRTKLLLETTSQFLETLSAFDKGPQSGQFRSKVFQALRIEVNQELAGLEKLLLLGCQTLKKDGYFVVISYHSLEDRLVKNFFNAGNFEGKIEKDLYGNYNAPMRKLQKKALMPDEDEIITNNRARSAKLRIGIKN